jgi:hypothetical protein
MTLSANDAEPTRRKRTRPWRIALLAVVVIAVIVLHLTGVVGPQ